MIYQRAYEISISVSLNSERNRGGITASLICSIVHKILDIDIRVFYLFKRFEIYLSIQNIQKNNTDTVNYIISTLSSF